MLTYLGHGIFVYIILCWRILPWHGHIVDMLTCLCHGIFVYIILCWLILRWYGHTRICWPVFIPACLHKKPQHLNAIKPHSTFPQNSFDWWYQMQQSHWLENSWWAGIDICFTYQRMSCGYSFYTTTPLERSNKTIPTSIADDCELNITELYLHKKMTRMFLRPYEPLNVKICR